RSHRYSSPLTANRALPRAASPHRNTAGIAMPPAQYGGEPGGSRADQSGRTGAECQHDCRMACALDILLRTIDGRRDAILRLGRGQSRHLGNAAREVGPIIVADTV